MKKDNMKIVIIYILMAFFLILNITFNISKEGICKIIIIAFLSIIATLITMYLNQNVSIEKKFLIIGTFIGVILVFAIPVLHGIDEVAHFYKAYSIFNEVETTYDEQGKLMYKLPTAIDNASKIKRYSDVKNLQGQIISNTETILTNTYGGIALYSNIAYITYWIPMLICQNILKLPIVGVVLISRLFSFILWLLMSLYTIKIMPKRKEFMAFMCLIPINLTLVTTFTGDLLTNSAILLFIAYWYRLYEEKREIRKSEIIVISTLGCVSICCKIIYALLFLLVFLLPKENFKNKRHKAIVISVIMFVMLIVAFLNLSIVGQDLLEAYPAIEHQKDWIINNLFGYISILVRTVITSIPAYIYQFTTGDGAMAQCSVSVSTAVSILYFIILIASLYIEQIDIKWNKYAKYVIGVIISIIVLTICTSLYLQWTATNFGIGYNYITGIQGRYFYPLVALLALTNNKKKIDISKVWLWNGAIMINFYILLRIIIRF